MQDSCTRGAILKTSKWIFWNPDMKLEINPMWSGTKSRFSMVHACQTVNSMNSSPPQPSQVHPQCTVPSTNPACSVLTHHMQSGRPASFLWLSITTSASTTNWREQTMFRIRNNTKQAATGRRNEGKNCVRFHPRPSQYCALLDAGLFRRNDCSETQRTKGEKHRGEGHLVWGS